MSWKPTFASGKLVRNYEPLRYYLELVRGTEWYDKGFLSKEDFEKLVSVAKGELETGKLGELWDKLTEYFVNRVNGEKALEALKEFGYPVESEDEAKREIAKMLAGWLIEAGEEWEMIRLKDRKS